MKRVEIDVSGRSRLVLLHPGQALGFVLLLVLIVAVILAALGLGFGINRSTHAKQLARIADQIEFSEQAREQASAQASEISPATVDAINTAVSQLNYPWLDVFGALQKYSRPSIHLLSIETGPTRQGARLIFEADSIDEALRYMGDLKKEKLFMNASLVKQETGSSANARGLRFTLEIPSGAAVEAMKKGGI